LQRKHAAFFEKAQAKRLQGERQNRRPVSNIVFAPELAIRESTAPHRIAK
jgi:hypothetical protein